ncbi:hypothetical protein ASZ78_016036 [Callipepla squamata]|uniref:TFIIS N-terminal domain-containing protein n=1 Tax=Callipepla squamata TaxID=9009 RepID=A0A226NAH2_CALSU|nr:hypothetical protein ASZ78_016036 [Callipepla squamata]
MERFVVRRARSPQSPRRARAQPRAYRQATLESLKASARRVVVLEDIKRWKAMLELPGQPKENLMEALGELKKKIPSKEVLLSTQIGRTVNKMRKHSDRDVAGLAKDVYVEWRAFIKHHSDRPSIEVKSDPKTEAFRKKARKLLCEALDLEVVFIFTS